MKCLKLSDKYVGIIGGSLLFMILYKIVIGLLYSLQGGIPVAISIRVQPIAQISEKRVYSIFFTVSGAIQFGVPLKDDLSVFSISSSTLIFEQPPKSESLHTPSRSTRIFPPLISYTVLKFYITLMNNIICVKIF